MNFRLSVAFAGLTLLVMPALQAQSSNPTIMLRYRFTPGQTLRYLIQRDPYFNDPAGAIETTDPNAPYRPPVIERLTEEVLAVGRDGTATVRVTVAPEPGFEDETKPQSAVSQTVQVTPLGQVLSPLPETMSGELLRAFFRLPVASVRPGAAWKDSAGLGTILTLTKVDGGRKGLAVITQTPPPSVAESRSRSHDGMLVQTTRCAQSDHLVFDLKTGNLRRERSTMTVTLSLVMTGRGARGADDFGHVIPRVQVVQTLTIERRDDLAAPPSHASTNQALKEPISE